MLNDRSFEGVKRVIDSVYFDSTPGICDREWQRNPAWSYDTLNPFNGTHSARLTASEAEPGSLTQSGLAVKKGMTYACSGWLRSDQSNMDATIVFKTLLPTGDWMTLASAELPPLSSQWKRFAVEMKSGGGTDRAVFELGLEGQGSAWVDKLSAMPADYLRGWRQDAVAAIKDLQPKLVRWGGSVCDPGEYRWKTGIGDRRSTRCHPPHFSTAVYKRIFECCKCLI